MKQYAKKEVSFERVLFFSDAVVAIAITLLALDLKIEVPDGQQLSFKDLVAPWHKYLAFVLSFINIAGFWRLHHDFFIHIRKLDERMMYLNICWLFFIVVLPFSTSVLSSHFGDTAAVFIYSLNIFILSVFQNFIWDYADRKEDYISREYLPLRQQVSFRTILNLDMLNGLVAIGASFFFPKLAFFLLFFKLPLFFVAPFVMPFKRRKAMENMKDQANDKTRHS